MAVLGPNDLKQWAIPTNWDASRLMQESLVDGITYDSLISEITTALSVQNGLLLTNTLGGMVSTTDEAAVEYGIGVSNGFQDHTEYTAPDPRRGKTTGHMLPLNPYDRAFGWTWDFLRKARRVHIIEDIASGMEDLRNKFQILTLTRFFKSTYDAVGSGKSVPFCDAGTADSTYIPKNHPERTTAFDATHTHLLRLNGITQANVLTAVTHLWEHGHDAPFDIIAAQADVSSWTDQTSVTGYIPRANGLIQYGSGQDTAVVAEPDVLGVIETEYGPVRLRLTARIPTAYWGVYKSYGQQDQRNPLKIRYGEYGIGAILLAGDHIRQYPIENAIMFMEMGAGVGDRTAGVLVENDSTGSYASPTIV